MNLSFQEYLHSITQFSTGKSGKPDFRFSINVPTSDTYRSLQKSKKLCKRKAFQ